MGKRKVYVAGPMTGVENYNFPAFFECAEALRLQGHDVTNPADNDGPTVEIAVKNAAQYGDWAEYLRRDIPRMLPCDTICLLPNWEMSKGARLEVHIARELGMAITCWHEGALKELIAL